jgi:hypothetical protein
MWQAFLNARLAMIFRRFTAIADCSVGNAHYQNSQPEFPIIAILQGLAPFCGSDDPNCLFLSGMQGESSGTLGKRDCQLVARLPD